MALSDLGDSIKQALGLDNREPEISWENRLGEASYTPASGVRITFDYTDLEKDIEKLGTLYNFPSAFGAYLQEGAVNSDVFPMVLFFAGPDYDMAAKVFESAISESGGGVLEHPMYGTHNVGILGTVKRFDRLVSGANQAEFRLIFYKTITDLFPAAQEDLRTSAKDALAEFGIASAEGFASSLDLNSAAEEQGFLETVNGLLDNAEGGLRKIAAVQAVINDQFTDITDSIKRSLDVLVGQPLTLAFQTQQMLLAPGRALADIRAQINAYGGLSSDIFGGSDSISNPGGVGALGPGPSGGGIGSTQTGGTAGSANDSQSPNRFHARDLFASTYASAAALSALDTVLETRTQAIESAQALVTQLADLNVWRDDNFEAISGQNLSDAEKAEFIITPKSTDDGSSYQALQKVFQLTIGYLVGQSLQLRQEMELTLDRDRALVELVSDIWQDEPDDHLDFFIDSNKLTTAEIIELPRGRTVVYYL